MKKDHYRFLEETASAVLHRTPVLNRRENDRRGQLGEGTGTQLDIAWVLIAISYQEEKWDVRVDSDGPGTGAESILATGLGFTRGPGKGALVHWLGIHRAKIDLPHESFEKRQGLESRRAHQVDRSLLLVSGGEQFIVLGEMRTRWHPKGELSRGG